ncbi:hypothetical protein HAZT_HAZT006400 [Hyalella azteca]|uniref:Uncharacterized protein n=1 Tax=Hyalella azteca TaxID=294128 RepID=A0A6A0GTY7_HYAAZ|nr:hypothetical protein HAZT_HAZT006400 [Hyalella azteca]
MHDPHNADTSDQNYGYADEHDGYYDPNDPYGMANSHEPGMDSGYGYGHETQPPITSQDQVNQYGDHLGYDNHQHSYDQQTYDINQQFDQQQQNDQEQQQYDQEQQHYGQEQQQNDQQYEQLHQYDQQQAAQYHQQQQQQSQEQKGGVFSQKSGGIFGSITGALTGAKTPQHQQQDPVPQQAKQQAGTSTFGGLGNLFGGLPKARPGIVCYFQTSSQIIIARSNLFILPLPKILILYVEIS